MCGWRLLPTASPQQKPGSGETHRRGVVLPTAEPVSAEPTDRPQLGWKCVKAVRGVCCTVFCQDRVRWLNGAELQRGVLIGGKVTRCPKPATDYISHTCGEALRGTHAAGIFRNPRSSLTRRPKQAISLWRAPDPADIPSLWLPRLESENCSKITRANCSADNLHFYCHMLD